ncbi:hypothetical protein [Candidatus Entotheonella palauensis]|uniref:hypothetical protein n=1 Tax=Candidatus Entotheonella palauensis TaxID=93172 RepID=UPI001178041B|nr:hypothetical protein [Candidatus Entotheonella palauensis]
MSSTSFDATLGFTRRHFLKTSVGVIGLSVSPMPLRAIEPQAPPTHATPGVASQRIEGIAKVTGAKIYARDFNAHDMKGWPTQQWYALFLRAIHADRVFLGVDLSSLPSDARPTKLLYGDEIEERVRPNEHASHRALHANAFAAEASDVDIKIHQVLNYDLVVRRNRRPDYLGQAVALLLFDSLAGYRAAKKFLQFKDAKFQSYGSTVFIPPTPVYGRPTDYVRVAGTGEKDVFSYVQNASDQDACHQYTYLNKAKDHTNKFR